MVFKGFQSFLKLVSCFGNFHVFQRFSVILEIGQLFSADSRRFPCYPVVLEIGQLFLGLLRSLKVDFHASQRFSIVFWFPIVFFSCWPKVFGCCCFVCFFKFLLVFHVGQRFSVVFSSFPLVLHVGQRFSDVFFPSVPIVFLVFKERFPALFS